MPTLYASPAIGRLIELANRVLARIKTVTVVVAIAEAMADPEFGLKHGGSTPGWQPLHAARGFKPGDSVVTITSVRTTSDPFTTAGETAERHLDYIVDWVKRMMDPYQSSRSYVETHVLQLTPVIATLLAKAGYSREDVANYLTKNATISARYYEWSMMQADHHPPGTTLAGLVDKGELPKEWRLSDDPERRVPLLLPQSQWLIVVAGDPLRNRSLIYRQNFMQGYATSKKVQLPAKWNELRM